MQQVPDTGLHTRGGSVMCHTPPEALFEARQDSTAFRGVRLGRNRDLYIEEDQSGQVRRYRTTKAALDGVLQAADQWAAAHDLYHRARLKRKARRLAKHSPMFTEIHIGGDFGV